MAVGIATRPMRILRRNSTGALVGGGAAIDSGGAPSYGWQTIPILMTLVAAGTLQIFQRQRASSTWAVTDTFALLGAGTVRTTVQCTGEQVRAVFTNDVVAQRPEILVSLDS